MAKFDSRTFLKTPKTTTIHSVPPGTYVHIGLKKSIDLIMESQERLPEELMLDFNIDGIPISRSTPTVSLKFN